MAYSEADKAQLKRIKLFASIVLIFIWIFFISSLVAQGFVESRIPAGYTGDRELLMILQHDFMQSLCVAIFPLPFAVLILVWGLKHWGVNALKWKQSWFTRTIILTVIGSIALSYAATFIRTLLIFSKTRHLMNLNMVQIEWVSFSAYTNDSTISTLSWLGIYPLILGVLIGGLLGARPDLLAYAECSISNLIRRKN